MKTNRVHHFASNGILWLTFILCSSVLYSQNIEDGWKGIKPFKTDKAAVNKLIGTPEIDDNGYYRYETDEAYFSVNYSTAPCAPDPLNPGIRRGEYNIPEGIVLSYYVYNRKMIKLQELNLNLKNYDRDTSGDVLNVAYYYGHTGDNRDPSNRNGITIGVEIRNGTEYVGKLIFGPSASDRAKMRCTDLVSK